MNSVRNLRDFPAGIPLLADDLVEFHAARVLLLILYCGTNDRITGLTKLAKLDFFVRYPAFFEEACRARGKPVQSSIGMVESHMIRFHYGPWDRRYYHIFAYLEARELLTVKKVGNAFEFELTEWGAGTAEDMAADESFADLVRHMKEVKRHFGRMNGSSLKDLVYQVFDQEVAKRELGAVIEP